jgi:hypothetical protein
VQAQKRKFDPDAKAELQRLVRNFNADKARSRQVIRSLFDCDRDIFLANSIEILKVDADSRGAHYLLSLLVAEDLLYQALCDPTLGRQQAVAIARAAVRVDPMADVALASRLASDALSDPDARGMGAPGRVMEILEEISGGPRILPCLMRLLRNANPYLRSKAVRMIGRGNRSVKWVRGRLGEADPRVRGNAVEALWNLDSEESRELLRRAARDPHNRVAANALVGLYNQGDVFAIPELLTMAGRASSRFRMSAAWAMGHTADPRFAEALGRMLADPSAAVRKRAFAAVAYIKAASTPILSGPPWRISCLLMREDQAASTAPRRLRVGVVSEEGQEQLGLRPTHFILTEDGQAVQFYKVQEKTIPEAMSVVFAFPRSSAPERAPWNQAALKCLERKRPVDLWCVVPYVDGPDGAGAARLDSEMPVLTADREVAAVALVTTPGRQNCTNLWSALERLVSQASSRGARHIVAYVPANLEKSPPPSLAMVIMASHTSLQLVSAGSNSLLKNFCDEVGGSFQCGSDDSQIEDLISRAYMNLFARYEVTYQPVCFSPTTIRLRVHSPQGWGDVVIQTGKAEAM